MKRFVLAVCAGALAVAMATPSRAADLPRPVYKAPAYIAPVFTWTGFYVGLNGGYGFGSSDYSGPLTSIEYDTKGWLGGATIGYNIQTGSWVWGVEADFDYTDIHGSAACPGGTCSTRINWLGTARGRIGWAFDRFLPYLTGGAAFGNVRMAPSGGGVDHDTQFGWTIGAGVEWAFMSAWSAKIEYLYVDLGDATCDVTNCTAAGSSVSATANIIRGGINYRW